MYVNFNILNQLGSPSINSNTFANRPAAGQTGRLFVSTDTFEIYRDNGTTWDLIGGPGAGTITGSGTATQVAYFTGAQTIGSSANLFWDNTNTRLGIGTATPGVRLDVHGTGTLQSNNSTGATNNNYLQFQRAGANVWRIGDTYNGGTNYYSIFNSGLSTNAALFYAATNKAEFTATETIAAGLATGTQFTYNLTVPNATTFGSPNAITALGMFTNITLQGNSTVPIGTRQGLDASQRISFTTAGTMTVTQGGTVRAFSNLNTVWSFNGTQVGTVTHLAGIRIVFPDNIGSAINVTNNYGILINDQTTGLGTVTYTNRWGIYQEGASDLNYFNGNMLLGSTTNSGQRLQVTGTALFTGAVTGTGNSSTYTVTAASGVARSKSITSTLVAAANNDTLVALDINPTFTTGAFTGVNTFALRVISNGSTLFNTNAGTPTVFIGDGSTNTNATLRLRKLATANTANVIFNSALSDIATISLNSSNHLVLTNTNSVFLFNSTGNLGINTATDAGFRLEVSGTARITGQLTVQSRIVQNSTDIAIGNNTPLSTAGLNVMIGEAVMQSPGGSATLNVAIGARVFRDGTVGNSNVAIGNATMQEGDGFGQHVVIGQGSCRNVGGTTFWRNTAVGTSIVVANTAAQYTVALGFGTRITAKNQFVCGQGFDATNDGAITDVYFGSGVQRNGTDNRGGVSYTINGSGALGTDFAGGNITIAGGKGTGAGAAGDVIFSTSSVLASGTTLQSLTSRWWVKGNTGQLSNVASPNASAAVQIDSTTTGFLLPRMTTVQKNAIAAPAAGLTIYDTTLNKLCVFTGVNWETVTSV